MGRIATHRLEARIAPLVDALAEAAVPAIVLKGPSTRLRLYGPQEVRPTGDIDLLVPARRRRRADEVLRARGFACLATVGHADTWVGDEGVTVDLHSTLPYASPEPARVWRLLAPHVVTLEVGERDLPVLDVPAHFVHLALHALQNGLGSGDRSLDELRRAVAVTSDEERAEAADLAERLGVGRLVATALTALDDHAFGEASGTVDGEPRRAPRQGVDELAGRLPLGGNLRAFLGSSISRHERRRALRAPLRRFFSDHKVRRWLAVRGRPFPATRAGVRLAKAERVVKIGARELVTLVTRRQRPVDTVPDDPAPPPPSTPPGA